MPTISGITGAVTHGQSITITGTGFGTKTVAAPVVWENSSGADGNSALQPTWDGTCPNLSITESKRIARRAPHRNVSPPHNRVGKYIAGCHDIEDFATNNYNLQKGGVVSLWKAIPATFPIDIYQSAWVRLDPAWVVAPDQQGKNNKTMHIAYSNEPSAYPGQSSLVHITMDYSNGNPGAFPHDINSTKLKHKTYASLFDGQTIYGGIDNCHNFIATWGKIEVLTHLSSIGGFFRFYENGRLVYGRNNDFQAPATSHVTTNFGDFARPYGSDIYWRYFTDCYIDNTFQRVLLGNAPSLDGSCTIREIQIPTSWSDTSVTATVNRGVFSDDDPVYVFVVDTSNVASSGFLVEPAAAEQPPVITSALSVFATEGSSESYKIVALNNPTSFTAGPLPSGRVLNPSTGEITGTYNQLGFTQTAVTATNAFGTDQETVSFDVSQAVVAGIDDPVNIGTASNKSDTTLFVTVQQAVPQGNTVFVLVSCRGGTTSTGIPTCSDNVSFDQYARDVYKTNADGSRKAALFRYSNNVELPAGSVITVSIDGGIGDAKAMTAFWVRGLDLISPLDVFNSAVTEVSTATPNSGQITTT